LLRQIYYPISTWLPVVAGRRTLNFAHRGKTFNRFENFQSIQGLARGLYLQLPSAIAVKTNLEASGDE
jgi:hypothetical protein